LGDGELCVALTRKTPSQSPIWHELHNYKNENNIIINTNTTRGSQGWWQWWATTTRKKNNIKQWSLVGLCEEHQQEQLKAKTQNTTQNP
jgi:hypothetical protein